MTNHTEAQEMNNTEKTKVYRKRQSSYRVTCPECREGIRKNQRYIEVDSKQVHEYCASDAGKVLTCPNCFILGGQCACDI